MKNGICFFLVSFLSIVVAKAQTQDTATVSENDYFKLTTVPIPADIILEVGGLKTLPDGRLIVTTRRGELWLVENPYMKGARHLYSNGSPRACTRYWV
jgi:hypothetical protein